MKIALCLLACFIGCVLTESCISKSDCINTSCASYFEVHCLDSGCVCLSPATGATCNHSKDCERADHGHEHCAFSDNNEWKCVDNQCRCVRD